MNEEIEEEDHIPFIALIGRRFEIGLLFGPGHRVPLCERELLTFQFPASPCRCVEREMERGCM